MLHDDLFVCSPFLHGKPLGVDVFGTQSGTLLIDHVESSKVVNVDAGWIALGETEVVENRTKVQATNVCPPRRLAILCIVTLFVYEMPLGSEEECGVVRDDR